MAQYNVGPEKPAEGQKLLDTVTTIQPMSFVWLTDDTLSETLLLWRKDQELFTHHCYIFACSGAHRGRK